MGVSFNPDNQKLYVCDHNECRVKVLNTDLTFHSAIGRPRTEYAEFEYIYTNNIAFNSNGDIYVTDFYNDIVENS